MRDLNECKAEIFRRMEEGIRVQKSRRRRVLACCVPLCLCAVLLSVFVLPRIMPAGDKTASGNGPGETLEYTPESEFVYQTQMRYLSVAITDGETVSAKETDPSKATALYILLDKALSAEPPKAESIGGGDSDTEDKDRFYYGSTNKTNCCVFVFSASDGREETLRLNGNVLSRDNSDQLVILSDTARDTLVTEIEAIVEMEVPQK